GDGVCAKQRDSHRSSSGGVATAGFGLLIRSTEIEMHRRASTSLRNKLDLSNRVQVRIVRKRLKISEEQLNDLVRKAGDSIAAVRKEAGSRHLLKLPQA